MVASVTETKAGTIPKAEGNNSPEAEGKTPSDASKVSSESTPKYTEAELKAAVHAAKSEAGREKQTLELERDGFKTKLEAKEEELVGNTAELEKLQTKLEDMSSDDPDRYDVVKELKAAREERKQLKADRQALEAEKTTHGERIKRAESFEREAIIQELVEDYENGDFNKLKDLCDTFSATSEEQIRKVADTLWVKKDTEPEPTLVISSGRTAGGAVDFSSMSADEKIRYALNHKK